MTHLTKRQASGVTVLSADRPPANAMNLEFLGELVAELTAIADDPPAALVVAGRDGFFSGGVDLKAVPGYGPAEQRRMVDAINRMVLITYPLPCPVVAAVTGHAVAGGLVFALCADYRVASTAGRYGLTEVKVGVPYPQAAIGVVRAELTPPAARILALTNRLLGARECAQMGVFDEVVDPAAVTTRAIEVATELAAFPTATYARTKLELRAGALAAMCTASAADPLLESWVS